MPIYLVLNNIRSLHNVGAIFRTADGAGVEKIFLTGYTPTPYDFFGKIKKDFQKTALGAEKSVDWARVQNIHTLIKRLKKDKFQIVSLEQSKNSIDIRKFKPRKNLALILGNEVGGIPKSVLKKSDAVLEIPMFGKKESLNVSVAAGVALYMIRFALQN